MGIKVEFNPDLALRKFGAKNRLKEECLPENFEEGKVYDFLKKGRRVYWMEGEVPLMETKGKENLSDPLASIVIIESTYFKKGKEIWTKGKYELIKIIEENEIYFNGFNKIR
jgi:hypothetical protein